MNEKHFEMSSLLFLQYFDTFFLRREASGSILSVESNQNVESKTNNVESKIAFGQLILRKIIKTVATRCQILRLKCTKIQNPLAGFKGPTSKERGGRRVEGRGEELWSPKTSLR